MASGQLAPSPSDSALNKRSQDTEPAESQDDDRSALSEVISDSFFVGNIC